MIISAKMHLFILNSALLLVLRVAVYELSKGYYSHTSIISHGTLCHTQYSACWVLSIQLQKQFH